jgi:hypothetical protein
LHGQNKTRFFADSVGDADMGVSATPDSLAYPLSQDQRNAICISDLPPFNQNNLRLKRDKNNHADCWHLHFAAST